MEGLCPCDIREGGMIACGWVEVFKSLKGKVLYVKGNCGESLGSVWDVEIIGLARQGIEEDTF